VTNRREAAIREARAAWSASTRARLSMYSALLWCLAPLVLLRLAWRARAEPPYGQAIGERFGGAGRDGPAAPGALWLHAVSLGETRAAEPLLAALRARQPGLRLLLTHGTATGRGAGARLLATGDAQRWQPFDLGHATRSFFHTHRPVLGVLMETEVWPNLLCAAADAGVPVVLANARLSERSLRRGQRVRTLLQPAFASLAATLAQTDDDAARLASAGAREPRVCGNLKFDAAPAPALLEQGRAWKAAAGERPSSWPRSPATARRRTCSRPGGRARPGPGRASSSCRAIRSASRPSPALRRALAGRWRVEARGLRTVPTTRGGRPTSGSATRCSRCPRTTRSPTSPCSAAASARSAART
jgi:hypothetical protein